MFFKVLTQNTNEGPSETWNSHRWNVLALPRATASVWDPQHPLVSQAAVCRTWQKEAGSITRSKTLHLTTFNAIITIHGNIAKTLCPTKTSQLRNVPVWSLEAWEVRSSELLEAVTAFKEGERKQVLQTYGYSNLLQLINLKFLLTLKQGHFSNRTFQVTPSQEDRIYFWRFPTS